MTTVGANVAHLLHALGVRAVFGIPGVQTLEFFRGVQEARLRFVLSRTEQGAVFAADGYARTTGLPGVALLIAGPGLTNAATAVAQAHHDSIPLLVVSAAPPTTAAGGGRGALHELPDQRGFMSSITAWSAHVEDPDELPDILAAAFESFASGRPRPVHVQLPADLLRTPAGPAAAPKLDVRRPRLVQPAVRQAAAFLTASSKPMILAGGGAVDAPGELLEVAERLGAPVVMTVNGKGILSDAHPLSLSTSLPVGSTLTAIADADVVLAVGTEFSEVDYYYAPTPLALGGRLVRVDIDPLQLSGEPRADVVLHARSTDALSALAAELVPSPQRLADGSRLAETIRRQVRWWPRAEPLMPLVDTIGEALPDGAIVASDSNQLGYIGQHAWPALAPRRWMVPAGWGTLGYALPMAIGAAVAHPDEPVVCVMGDGGLLFTIGEMATARDLGRPMLLVLWNNGGYQEMRDEFADSGIPPVGVEAAAHDYLTLARGFGWQPRRPRSLDEVPEAVQAAVRSEDPTLVELTPDLL